MDRSTGKQVTTKSRGNYVEVKLGSGTIDDGSGRLLEGDHQEICFATANMTQSETNNIEFQFQRGTELYFGMSHDSYDRESHGRVTHLSSGYERQTVGDFMDWISTIDVESFGQYLLIGQKLGTHPVYLK